MTRSIGGLARRLMAHDYLARWMLVAVVGAIAALWMTALGIGFDLDSELPALGFSALLLGLVAIYRMVAMRLPRLGGPVAVVNDLMLSLVQVLAIISVFLPLTYLAATTDFPLLDQRLAAVDAACFGFDWDTAAAWVRARPWLDDALQAAYGTIYWQGAVVLALGSLTRTGERNGEALWLFAVSLAITIAVFCFTPVLGKLGNVGDGQIVAMTAIRGGQLTVFTYDNVQGIIGFPSFHTTLAIILTYCARRQLWVLALAAPLNAVMLIGVPTVGGHYLTDLVGGAAVAGIAILIVRRLRGEALMPRVARSASGAVAAAAGQAEAS